MRCHFIPRYLLDHLINAEDEATAACARRTAAIDELVMSRPSIIAPQAVGNADWQVHDAENGTDLPGRLVRTAGEPDVADVTVNEAATGLTESLALCTD